MGQRHSILLALAWLALAAPVPAETLVATRTIRAATPIQPEDIAFGEEEVPGALSDPAQILGMEARAVIYAGRPIRPGDIAPAAAVERNQLVPINFRRGQLVIKAEGRALARGAPGEVIRVMNLASRTTVQGVIDADGGIHVLGGQTDSSGEK